MIPYLRPEWAAPAPVQALATTRQGGVSRAPWASLNLGSHVGDAVSAVTENRRRFRTLLPAEARWLNQVHGARCVDAHAARDGEAADAIMTRECNVVCAVQTADCLPVLLCDTAGTVVAAAHAGWRGLAAGVLEATLAAMATPADEIMAWLGPAIGPQAFEVGDEVRDVFIDQHAAAADAFLPRRTGKWLCDLPALAQQRLAGAGVRQITRSNLCTYSDPARFFSHRRDARCGRMACAIWIDNTASGNTPG